MSPRPRATAAATVLAIHEWQDNFVLELYFNFGTGGFVGAFCFGFVSSSVS